VFIEDPAGGEQEFARIAIFAAAKIQGFAVRACLKYIFHGA
jgi:hypothetical protein